MPTVDQPQIGKIYAAKVDSEWHRVEITDVHGIWVTCWYIDEGEKIATTVENIRELPGKFLTLPAQAVSVRLVGLEAFADNSQALNDVQREIETKALVAQVFAASTLSPLSKPVKFICLAIRRWKSGT